MAVQCEPEIRWKLQHNTHYSKDALRECLTSSMAIGAYVHLIADRNCDCILSMCNDSERAVTLRVFGDGVCLSALYQSFGGVLVVQR